MAADESTPTVRSGPRLDAAALADIVTPQHVLRDRDVRAGFESDWTGRYAGACDAVVRPATTAEVAAVLAHCDRHGIVVVPQSGNTGLVGGSVPRADGGRPTIVLSLTRLRDTGDVDEHARQVTLGAGVTIAEWQQAAARHGLDAPVDFAARDTATIGGAVATNAGGSRVVRFGTMRRQVAGIEAVLADGRIVGSLAGLPKETAGLHWPSVLTGSEGTLAVVTAARLRLVPGFARRATAMVAVESVDAAVALLGALRSLSSLDAVELIEPDALDLVAGYLGAPRPIDAGDGTVVLVECADHADPTADLADALASSAGVGATAVAIDSPQRDHLLSYRDRMTEAIAAAATAIGSPTFKLDVAVPVGALDELLAAARTAADDDGARLVAFGHLAEGNVHLNHLGASSPERLAERVLGTVAELGGTISAEHGIGVAKARWLPLVRSPGDLEAQRAIRAALDPNGILNPGVLDPLGPQVP